ncbi:MAG: 2-oxo acid dehydrogenase subunit E2 [Spirochaetes bacterium]|nr:2-oxo acid dehydrogenase subunit E2 [Spirochaetota bacterium]
MAEEVLMLALSPTMESGTILKWHKREGDPIKNGDVLCEVETDKATMEYESQNEGTLLKILVPEGGQAEVGRTIAVSGEKGEDVTHLIEREPEAKPDSKPPALSPTAETVSDEIPEKQAGLREQAAEKKPPVKPEKKEGDKAAEERLPEGVKASPLARKLAQEEGIDLEDIEGSGPGGRIIKRDLDRQSVSRTEERRGGNREIQVSAKRRVIARRLSESKYSAPHYYLTAVADAGRLVSARKSLNHRMEKKISFNAFLIRLAAEALKNHPMVNASFLGDTILQFGSADIGLAVAQPDGLIAPVVRDCWNKGILRIDDELKDLVERAQKGRLKPEEFTGATFTISNLGSFGIYEFTAIINPPGSAILAVGEIRREAYEPEPGGVGFRSVMHLTLSCDHRVIDGAVGARFLKSLVDMIEDPITALL